MKHNSLESAVIDILNLIMHGRLVDALSKYYHNDSWHSKHPLLSAYTKGSQGRQVLKAMRCNRCLFVEKAIGVGIGNNVSFITWVYSGTEGSLLQNNCTITNLQFWENGQIVREEYIHAN